LVHVDRGCGIFDFLNLLAFTAEGLGCDELKPSGLHEKHAIATWNLGTISALAWSLRKTRKTFVEMAGRRTFRLHTDI
jgi:hypothetical protein